MRDASAVMWQGLREGVWGEFRSGSGKMREEHQLLVQHPQAAKPDDMLKLLELLSQDKGDSVFVRGWSRKGCDLLKHAIEENKDAIVALKPRMDALSQEVLEFQLLLTGDVEALSEQAWTKLATALFEGEQLAEHYWVNNHGLMDHITPEKMAGGFERGIAEGALYFQNFELYEYCEPHLSTEAKVTAMVRHKNRAEAAAALRRIKSAKAELERHVNADTEDERKKKPAAFYLALLLADAGEPIPESLDEYFRYFICQPAALEIEKKVFCAIPAERIGPVLAVGSGTIALLPYIEGNTLIEGVLERVKKDKDAAARVSSVVGKVGPRLIPVLNEALKGKPAAGVTILAARAGAHIATAESAEMLVGLLGASSKVAREAAQSSLGGLGAVAQPAIEAGLKAKKKAIREACKELLGQLDAAESIGDSPLGALEAELAKKSEAEALRAKLPSGKDTMEWRNFGIEAMKEHKALAFLMLRDFLVEGLPVQSYPHASYYSRDVFHHLLLTAFGKITNYTRLPKEEVERVAYASLDIVGRLPKMKKYNAKNVIKALDVMGEESSEAAAFALTVHGRPALSEPLFRLAALKPETNAEVLVGGLDESGKGIRTTCIEALAKVPGCVDAVIPLLKSKKKAGRESAALVLKALGSSKAADAITAALDKEKSEDVRFALEDALRASGGQLSESKAVPAPDADAPAKGADYWSAELTAGKKARLPKWLPAENLAQLRLKDGGVLSPEATAALVGRLKKEHERQDGVAWSLKNELDPDSAKAFGLALLNGWKRNRAKAADKWVLYAQALFADEEWIHTTAVTLDSMSSGGRHAAAGWHLDVYQRMGHKLGLDWIGYWADNAMTQGLQKKAIAALAELAQAEGLPRQAQSVHSRRAGRSERGRSWI